MCGWYTVTQRLRQWGRENTFCSHETDDEVEATADYKPKVWDCPQITKKMWRGCNPGITRWSHATVFPLNRKGWNWQTQTSRNTERNLRIIPPKNGVLFLQHNYLTLSKCILFSSQNEQKLPNIRRQLLCFWNIFRICSTFCLCFYPQ